MRIETRQEKIEELFNECLQILEAKGRDYSGNDDSLSNFKRNAERLGMTKYQIWAIYFAKHVDSVLNSIKNSPYKPQVESEPLRGRIQDIINYSAILECLLSEDENMAQNKG